MAYLFRNKLIKKMLWGRKDFPMAIYHENVHKQRYVKPVYDGKAKLTLSDGSIVEISGTGALTSAETRAYSATTIAVEIGSGCTKIGAMAFSGRTNLTSVTISDSVTIIDGDAFDACSGLTSVVIPDSVTSIYGSAFRDCYSLTSIKLPNGITEIYTSLLDDCISLTSLTIPSGVTSIGTFAFYNCSALTSVTVLATTPPTLASNSLLNTGNCPIYVPAESVDAYKTASGWLSYASRIQPIT